MNRLYVGFPLYKSVSSRFFAHWLYLDKTHLASVGHCDGIHLSAAFTTIVKQALSVDGWDRLVFLEHDVLPPLNVLNRIAYYASDQEIVGSVIFEHAVPHNVYAYVERNGAHHSLTSETVQRWCAEPALYQVDAVGFGCTSVARHVLENWNPAVKMFHIDDKRYGSQDMWFCDHARQQGYRVFLDTYVVCEHLTETPIGASHNAACANMVGGESVGFAYDQPASLL